MSAARFGASLLFLVVTAWAQDAAQPAAAPKTVVVATGNIEGTVSDSTTGEPLGGATITLHAVRGQEVAGSSPAPKPTRSMPDGHFVLEDVLAGRYLLSVDREGYVSDQYGAREPGSPGRVLELKGEQDITAIAIRLLPESVISGQVTDEDLRPVRSVMVLALRSRYVAGRRSLVPAGGGTTNAAGGYRITNLAPGRYYLLARPVPGQKNEQILRRVASPGARETYIPAFYPTGADDISAASIDIGIGMELRRLDISLRRAEVTTIRGQVTDSPGNKPAFGAVVTVSPANTSELGIQLRRTALADETGRFEIADVLPGAYVVSADLFDGDTRYFASDFILAENPGRETVLSLAPGLPLEGSIRQEDLNGNPSGFPGVNVELQSFTDAVFSHIQAKTSASGSFRLENVVPGQFAVSASNLPEGMYIKGIRYAGRELKTSSCTVGRGIALPLEIIVGTSHASASGVVLDGDGNPVAGALVALVPDASAAGYDFNYRSLNTDDKGKFYLGAVAPGRYTAFAWRNAGEAGFRDPAALKKAEQYGVSLDLSGSENPSIELRQIPAGP
jgi:protocatechuate 3,4-dioxygenase beta subunit